MTMPRVRVCALLLSLLLTTGVAAQVSNLPVLTQPVNDTAGVLDDASIKALETQIRALREATGDVVIVTTVPSITPYATVEEYAVKLFEKAGIGSKKLDNGMLVLVAIKEHGIRVEVGYGLEGIVTDGFAGDTIRQFMVPEFKANRYGPGLVAGTTHLIDRIAAARKNPGAATEPPVASTKSSSLGLILFIVICAGVLGIILFVIYMVAKVTGGARSTPSGGSLGGFGGGSSFTGSDSDNSSSSSSSSSSDSGGFDGGSSGGGGASGSW